MLRTDATLLKIEILCVVSKENTTKREYYVRAEIASTNQLIQQARKQRQQLYFRVNIVI